MATNTTEMLYNSTWAHGDCLVLKIKDFIPWNNPDNIISYQTEELVRKLKDLLFLPVMFLIGVPANVVNMAVFFKQGLKERINVCLFALSLADCLYLTCNMMWYGEQLYIQFTTKETYGPVMTWMTNHYLLGFYGFAWVSQIMSAIIASERCFCILQPFRSQTVLRTSTLAAIVVCIYVVVVGVRFVVATRYNVVCAYNPVSDSVTLTTMGSEFYYKHQKLVDFLDIIVYGVILPGVVVVVVMATTIVTVIKLRQAAEWRADTSSGTGNALARDIALTRMLVGNSILFIACIFPMGLLRFVLLFMPEMNAGRRNHNLFMAGLWLGNISSYTNATFNFVVYYTMGSRYRHTVWSLLGRKTANTTDIPSHKITR